MESVLHFDNVALVRGATQVLNGVNWNVQAGEHWVIVGPNGAGKTSLIQIAATFLHPSSGAVRILDEPLGLTDVSDLRPRIGVSSAAMAERIDHTEKVLDVVRTAAFGMTGTWQEQYEEQDTQRALNLVAEWGLQGFEHREFGTLSEGEKKRVLIARALMTNPEVIIMDEPAAGLDIAAREDLLALLDHQTSSPNAPVNILVTHHVEEIPQGMTHAMIICEGVPLDVGPIHQVLTSENISAAFGVNVHVDQRETHRGKRWTVSLA